MSWKGSLTTEVVAEILRMVAEMTRDEHLAATTGIAHRPLRQPQRIQDHVVLSLEDYSPPVKAAFHPGFTIAVDCLGKPRVVSVRTLKEDTSGLDAERLRTDVARLS